MRQKCSFRASYGSHKNKTFMLYHVCLLYKVLLFLVIKQCGRTLAYVMWCYWQCVIVGPLHHAIKEVHRCLWECVCVIPGQIVWMEKRFLLVTHWMQYAEGAQSPAARVSHAHTHTYTFSLPVFCFSLLLILMQVLETASKAFVVNSIKTDLNNWCERDQNSQFWFFIVHMF